MPKNETMVEQARERIVNIWCEYANRLISPHGNDMQAISMRTDAMAATSRALNQVATQAVREREGEIIQMLRELENDPTQPTDRQVGFSLVADRLEKEPQNEN